MARPRRAPFRRRVAAAGVAAGAALLEDAGLAGRHWGAIEAELDATPVGQWPAQCEEYEAPVLGVDGDAFEAAPEEGRLLILAEAVGRAPAAQTEP